MEMIEIARRTAADLGYMIEEDFRSLCDITEMTAEAWRKRHHGPAYVRAGNRYLYPTTGVTEWLAGNTKTWDAPAVALL